MDKSKLLRASLTAHLRKYNAEMLADYMVTLFENGKTEESMRTELMTFVSPSDAQVILEWFHSELDRLGLLHSHQQRHSNSQSNSSNSLSSIGSGHEDARNIIRARKYSHSKYENAEEEGEEEVRPSRGLEELTAEDMQPLRHKPVKCPYLPNCRAPPGTCVYFHPTENCRYFPNCQFGTACLYYHPPQACRFQDKCKNPNCNYLHSTSISLPFSNANSNYNKQMMVMCRYGEKCKNENCAFAHSNGHPCRFGAMCTNGGCPFEHPPERLMERHARYSKINAMCRFGKRCSKADCPFMHEDDKDDMMISNANINSISGIDVNK